LGSHYKYDDWKHVFDAVFAAETDTAAACSAVAVLEQLAMWWQLSQPTMCLGPSPATLSDVSGIKSTLQCMCSLTLLSQPSTPSFAPSITPYYLPFGCAKMKPELKEEVQQLQQLAQLQAKQIESITRVEHRYG